MYIHIVLMYAFLLEGMQIVMNRNSQGEGLGWKWVEMMVEFSSGGLSAHSLHIIVT